MTLLHVYYYISNKSNDGGTVDCEVVGCLVSSVDSREKFHAAHNICIMEMFGLIAGVSLSRVCWRR